MGQIDKQTPIADTKLASWGNSKAARIPSTVLTKLNYDSDQKFDIYTDHDRLILVPIRSSVDPLDDLLATYVDDGQRDREHDWGPSQGGELSW